MLRVLWQPKGNLQSISLLLFSVERLWTERQTFPTAHKPHPMIPVLWIRKTSLKSSIRCCSWTRDTLREFVSFTVLLSCLIKTVFFGVTAELFQAVVTKDFVDCSFSLCLSGYFCWLMHREGRITSLIFMAFLCEAQPSSGLIVSLREGSLTCDGDTPQSVFSVFISCHRDRRESRWCDKVIMHRNLKCSSPHHSVAAEMKISHDNASTHLNKKIALVVIAFICSFILLLVQKVHPRKKKLT